MKICLVNCISLVRFDETSLEYGVGGAQTYLICLSESLASVGHDVTVVCQCESEHVAQGVKWIPIEHVFYANEDRSLSVFASFNFEVAIVSRPSIEYLRTIVSSGVDLYVVFHGLDEGLCNGGIQILDSPNVRRVVALTSWHAEYLKHEMGVDPARISVVPNGIRPEDYDVADDVHSVDHSILWSSEPRRGLDIMCTLAKDVRKSVKDFCIYVSTPSYCCHLPENDDYTYLGHLSKKSLYGEMRRHAVWFYPSVYKETFCITALEASMSGNMPVLPVRYGPTDILGPFADEIGMKNDFDGDFQNACMEASELICRNILDYDMPVKRKLRKELQRYILNNFTWSHVASMYSNLLYEI